MKNSPNGRRRTLCPQPVAFKLSPVAAGCAALLFAVGSAYAQQAEPAKPDAAKAETDAAKAKAEREAKAKAEAAQKVSDLGSVTVTGIRRGIEAAISVKKNSDSIVEAVSAEDIGKLPDTSIAESIARLPGVAAQRTAGRAQQISIRGMSPDFSTGLLNGREQVTTGDSRGVEYDQYPSELLSAVVIYKTPDAALVGQGLSGTVDLQTVRPLDFGKRTVAVNYRGEQLGVGSVAKGNGSRFSLSYIDQFADRTLGVALGFARLDETGGTTSRFVSWGGGTYNTVANKGNDGCKVGTTAGCVNVPYNGFEFWSDQTTQTRDGAMAVLQFQPNKQFASTLDLFYSTFDMVTSHKAFQAPLNDSWAGGTYDKPGSLSNVTLSGNDVTAGTFNNVRGVVRNDAESTKDKLTSIGWNNKLALDNGWTAKADLSYSNAKRTGVIAETTAGTAQSTLGTAPLDSIAFTNGQTAVPGLNYADRSIIKLTDVQGWGGGTGSPQAGYSKQPHVQDTINAVRLSAKHDLPESWPLTAVDFGVNFTDRKKTREYIEGRLVIKGGNPLAAVDIPGAGTAVAGTSGISIATFDPVAAIGSIYDVVSKVHPDIFNKDWTVKEKVNTFYTKGDIDTTLFGLPLRGNVGLQLVSTNQSSTAYNVDRAGCTSDTNCPAASATVGTSYTDVLPSMNLAFDLGRDQIMRVGLARVMARPTMNDMRASFSFSYDSTKQIYTGDGGNPNLKPFRANAVDLSYEKYFGTKAYVGVAGFYKQLDTYIVRITDPNFDFTPYKTASTPPAASNIGQFTRPFNGSGGSIQGIELSASLPLNLMTKYLDGFGIVASYSDTSSSVNLPTSGVNVDNISTNKIPLPGLSKRVGGLTFYYENHGFSARVAERMRSEFVGEVSSFTGDRQLTYIKGEAVTDLQIGYELQSGPAKGLSVLLQINNLTDTPFVRYKDVPSNEIERVKYGKTYLFGLNYKM